MQAKSAQTRERRESEGHFTRQGFREHFDARAQELVRLSGEEAIRRIESGQAGDNAGWVELKLLSPLVKR